MKEKEVLIKLGLTEKEARAYLLALELGEVNSGDLIKKLTIYSKTAYEILNKLVEKGFLSTFLKGNIKFYSPINPSKIQEIVEQQQIEIDEVKKEVEGIIPVLKQISKASMKRQQATIYEGKKGIKYLFGESLKQKDEIWVLGGGGKFKEYFPEYSELWHRLRVKSKIKLRLLYDEGLRKKNIHYEECEIKFLPKEFDNPSPTMIYRNKVIITIWEENPLAFVIESKEVTKSYKNYFEVLWKVAKK